MLLTQEKIKNIFKKLLNKEISREEANRWAYKIIKEDDKNNLTILPNSIRNKIYEDGLMYLLAVDHQMYKNTYDESMEDIQKVYDEKWQDENEINNEIEVISMDLAGYINDNWVQCSNESCEEIFLVSDKEKYIECPRCLKIQLNPNYNGNIQT